MRTALESSQLSIGYLASYHLGGNGLNDSVSSAHDDEGGSRD